MKKKVILVHGYFKTEKDMFVLKTELEKRSFEVVTINLPLTFKKLKSVLPFFKREVEKIIAESEAEAKINFVGHSTGGLLIRRFLAVTEDKDIHFQEETADLVTEFLESGSFNGGDKNGV
jgi:triacylglycerol esterase/lipase EstA (alpha/beta hydrolase family)